MPSSKFYIRIVCEGSETEPNYFNGWIRSVGIKAVDVAFKPRDHSPMGVARAAKAEYQAAIKLKIPPSKIFIFAVFDRDGHPFVPEAISMLEGAGEPNTVTTVLQKGYTLNERVLRPALVMVAK